MNENLRTKLLGLCLSAIGLIGLCLATTQLLATDIEPQRLLIRFDYFSALITLALLSLVYGAQSWRATLRLLCGQDIGFRRAFSQTSLGLGAKYVPGKIWGIISRIGMNRPLGINTKSVTQASLLEHGLGIASLAWVGLLAYSLSITKFSPLVVGLLLCAPLLLWPIHNQVIFVIDRILMLPSLSRRVGSISFPMLTLPDTLRLFKRYIIQACFIGSQSIVLYLILFGETSAQNCLHIFAAFNLSVAAGLFAIFTPGGLGVREFGFAWLAAPLLNFDDAMTLALYQRAFNIFYDVIAAIVGLLLSQCDKTVNQAP